ncbi:hypothetical protein [Corallococcus sp. 4LFB]|uniref:hypothetical protein n=1 Tax=Corallococcus sp. 4LFB TaxID=3383249 RepID=UPI0039762CA5
MGRCKTETTPTCHCGQVLPAPEKGRKGAPKKWCSPKCADAASRLGLTARAVDDPGPKYDVPLDGLDFQARERQREERIARVIAEGVPLAALCERFDCAEKVVRRVAELRGLTIHTSFTGSIPVLGA